MEISTAQEALEQLKKPSAEKGAHMTALGILIQLTRRRQS